MYVCVHIHTYNIHAYYAMTNIQELRYRMDGKFDVEFNLTV